MDKCFSNIFSSYPKSFSSIFNFLRCGWEKREKGLWEKKKKKALIFLQLENYRRRRGRKSSRKRCHLRRKFSFELNETLWIFYGIFHGKIGRKKIIMGLRKFNKIFKTKYLSPYGIDCAENFDILYSETSIESTGLKIINWLYRGLTVFLGKFFKNCLFHFIFFNYASKRFCIGI